MACRNRALLESVLSSLGLDTEQPVRTFDADQWDAILDGLEGEVGVRWTKRWSSSTQRVEETRSWEGLR